MSYILAYMTLNAGEFRDRQRWGVNKDVDLHKDAMNTIEKYVNNVEVL